MKQKYIFFRNDDVFELTPNLKKLLRIFVLDKIPLTLSVIPEKITDDCSIYLKAICHKKNRLIEIAQHGLNHKNYSKNSEEKFEFGPRRKYIDQLRDISKGRRIIRSNFDRDPVIFVPPWNGFDCNTIKALQSENLKFFSTDIKHLASYQAGTLKQIFTNIYLNQKIADDLWITKNEFEVYKSIKLSKNNIFGIEMHDRHFGDADFIRLNRLIALLKKDRNIKLIPITHCEKYGRVEPSINPISLIYYLIYQFVPKPLCLFMYGNRSKTKSLFPYAFTPKHKIQKSPDQH